MGKANYRFNGACPRLRAGLFAGTGPNGGRGA